MIRIVPPELLPDLWTAVSGMLEKALQVHPFLSIDDLFQLVQTGRAELIVDFTDHVRCAAVMEAVAYPSKTVANVVALGGETGFMTTGLNNLLDFCEQWSIARGCKFFAMIGRPGWTPLASQRGFHSLKLIQAWKELESPDLGVRSVQSARLR